MAQNFQDDRETDLFGHPVRPRKGLRGRPPLEVTMEDRDMVEAGLARGWSNERIAKTVGISPASLKRYFRPALAIRDEARDRLELAAFSRLARAAIEEGNMSAMKQLRETMAQDALVARKADMARRQKEAEMAGVGIGKKAAQQMAAAQAVESDEWGDLLGDRVH